MSHKLSIIIPCYNCAATLEEALASVYTQHLTIPFEVIMVEDGSKDDTKNLMVELAKKYPHVSCYFHEKNRGGGAARNTGISKATGDLIYCLDSDNFFAPNTMQKMIDCLDEKKADGVAFSERRFFMGTNSRKYKPQFYTEYNRPVELADVFKNNILLDNFLFTKKSFLETTGYPENHGFDTQCFEVRFLSTEHKVYFCPNTSFYHRQAPKEKSYFERVYESGEFSKNMYLIYEEIFFLFSDTVKNKLMHFDIFKDSALSAKSFDGVLKTMFKEYGEDFFIKKYQTYLSPNSFSRYIEENKNDTSATGIFTKAVYDFKNKDYSKAIEEYLSLVSRGNSSQIIYYNILRSVLATDPTKKAVDIEKEVTSLVYSMQTKKQKLDLHPNILKKVAYRIRKIF